MHVLDQEHDSGGPARAQKDVTQDREGPLLELGAGQAIEELRRREDSGEVSEQDGPLFSLETEILEPLDDPALHFRR